MTVYKRMNTRADIAYKQAIDEGEEEKTRVLKPIITPYALEDPMYEYIREKKKREKDERIRQLKDLLDSSTDTSSDSSDSSNDKRKRKSKKKRKRDIGKKESNSREERKIINKDQRNYIKEEKDRHRDLDPRCKDRNIRKCDPEKLKSSDTKHRGYSHEGGKEREKYSIRSREDAKKSNLEYHKSKETQTKKSRLGTSTDDDYDGAPKKEKHKKKKKDRKRKSSRKEVQWVESEAQPRKSKHLKQGSDTSVDINLRIKLEPNTDEPKLSSILTSQEFHPIGIKQEPVDNTLVDMHPSNSSDNHITKKEPCSFSSGVEPNILIKTEPDNDRQREADNPLDASRVIKDEERVQRLLQRVKSDLNEVDSKVGSIIQN